MITSINEFKKIIEKLDNILEIKGILIINKSINNQEKIYSTIRSLTGVTILTTEEIMDADLQNKNKFRIKLIIKIDKYPFINNSNDGFDYQRFISSIKHIKGVIDFIVK